MTTGATWCGRPLEALTREELIDALVTMAAAEKRAREQLAELHVELVRFWRPDRRSPWWHRVLRS